jgi:hypothetical protein
MKLSVKIRKYAPPEMKLREQNWLVRQALTEAILWWYTNIVPKKFDPGAVQRYQLHARNEVYNLIKRRMEKARLWISGGRKGEWVAVDKPPGPFRFTGAFRDQTLTTPGSAVTIRAVSTQYKKEVTISIPVPHPMSHTTREEFGKMIQEEIDWMADITWEVCLTYYKKLETEYTEETIE